MTRKKKELGLAASRQHQTNQIDDLRPTLPSELTQNTEPPTANSQ